MFERETKREKILEARHREMRLKERARSEGQESEVEEKLVENPQEVLDRARQEFFEVIEAELQRRARAETQGPHGKVPGMARTGTHSRDSMPWGGGQGSASAFQVKDRAGDEAAAQGEESQLPKDKEEEEEEKDAAKVSVLHLHVAFPLLAAQWLVWVEAAVPKPGWARGVSASVGW